MVATPIALNSSDLVIDGLLNKRGDLKPTDIRNQAQPLIPKTKTYLKLGEPLDDDDWKGISKKYKRLQLEAEHSQRSTDFVTICKDLTFRLFPLPSRLMTHKNSSKVTNYGYSTSDKDRNRVLRFWQSRCQSFALPIYQKLTDCFCLFP